MTFRIQISQVEFHGGRHIFPETTSTIEIRGDSRNAKVEYQRCINNRFSCQAGSISAGHLKYVLDAISSIQKLPNFGIPLPIDVYGRNVSVVIFQDNKLVWAYGIDRSNPPDDVRAIQSDYKVTNLDKDVFGRRINYLRRVAVTSCKRSSEGSIMDGVRAMRFSATV